MTNENESGCESAEQEFFTPNQLRDRLNLSISTLNAWRSKGIGPKFIRINGYRVLYRIVDVKAWENQQEKQTNTKRKGATIGQRKRKSTTRKAGK